MLQTRVLLSRTAIKRLSCRNYASLADTSIPSSTSSALPPSLYPKFKPGGTNYFGPQAPDSGLKKYRPRTPSLRHVRHLINPHLWKHGPYKPLTFPKRGMSRGGRNSTGRVTVRHRGGGHKRRIRTVDFARQAAGLQTVQRIEYDPGRSAHIALLKHDRSGDMSYIVAAVGMREGDVVESFRQGLPERIVQEMGASVDPGLLAARICVRGNCLPLRMIPPGTQVHCVGSSPNRGAVFCRSAGTYATVVGKDETQMHRKTGEHRFVVVKLSSGETRRVGADACATIGVVSNPMWQLRQLGKAGRSRWLGIRPTVRGVAMNACDHPHGGGRGKSKGNRIPSSPWGQQAKSGFKTRPKHNINTHVVEKRYRNFGRRRNKN